MLPDHIIQNLKLSEVDARWTNILGQFKIEPPCVIKHLQVFGDCSFGAFSYSDDNVRIYNSDVGRYCSIASGVRINPGHHPIGRVTTHPLASDPSGANAGLEDSQLYAAFRSTAFFEIDDRNRGERAFVGHDVWIGLNAILLQGVTVGTGAVIAAGAVVSRDVKPYEVVAGVPARVLKLRFPEATVERLLTSAWWELDLSKMPDRNLSNVDRFLDCLESAALPPYRPAPLVVFDDRIEMANAQ